MRVEGGVVGRMRIEKGGKLGGVYFFLECLYDIISFVVLCECVCSFKWNIYIFEKKKDKLRASS